MKIIKTIVHPKAKTLTVDIIKLEKGDEVFQECLENDKAHVERTLRFNPNLDLSEFMNDETEALYYFDVNGDYLTSLEDTVKDAQEHLEYIYSGEAARDRAEHHRTSQQERGAEGYGESKLYGQYGQ